MVKKYKKVAIIALSCCGNEHLDAMMGTNKKAENVLLCKKHKGVMCVRILNKVIALGLAAVVSMPRQLEREMKEVLSL